MRAAIASIPAIDRPIRAAAVSLAFGNVRGVVASLARAGVAMVAAVGLLRLPMLPTLLVLVPLGLVAATLGARRV